MPTDAERLLELARLVKRTRDAQRTYFRTREGAILNVCRDYERRLDRAVDEILQPPQPGLFDSGEAK